MNAILTSFLVVAIAEMGDKTQLLALTLAARFQRPWTVMLGILLATVANHALAAAFGAGIAEWIGPRVMSEILGVSFIGFGFWTLVPDEEGETKDRDWGPLATTIALFFLAEIGDKTQLATIALGARFGSMPLVTTGTTAGMLVADGLAVWLGTALPERVPMVWMRRIAAGLFFGLGALALIDAIR